MKKIVFFFLFLFSLNAYQAQDYVDLARFHYQTTPDNNFDSLIGKSNVQEFGADITLPIQLNDSNTIISGLYLEQIKTRIHPQSDYITFSTVNLKIGYNHQLSEKWNGTYILLPKFSSDFKKLTHKDFQLGGFILMKYSVQKNFKYHLGLYFNNELYGTLYSPLLGLYYKSPNNKLEANLTLPIWADVNYKLIDWLNIGTSFSSITKTYNLGNKDYFIKKKTNELFAYLQFTLKKSILIQTKAGYSIGRSYKAFNRTDKVDADVYGIQFGAKQTPINPTFKDGMIFQARLIYRFLL